MIYLPWLRKFFLTRNGYKYSCWRNSFICKKKKAGFVEFDTVCVRVLRDRERRASESTCVPFLGPLPALLMKKMVCVRNDREQGDAHERRDDRQPGDNTTPNVADKMGIWLVVSIKVWWSTSEGGQPQLSDSWREIRDNEQHVRAGHACLRRRSDHVKGLFTFNRYSVGIKIKSTWNRNEINLMIYHFKSNWTDLEQFSLGFWFCFDKQK